MRAEQAMCWLRGAQAGGGGSHLDGYEVEADRSHGRGFPDSDIDPGYRGLARQELAKGLAL